MGPASESRLGLTQAPSNAMTTPTETLSGLVERVTYHNAENGFCVLRVKARGQRDLVVVVGHAAVINAGEFISATGWWINDREHGLQFKAATVVTTQPTTLEGIEKYLGSGMIRGIGPVYAKALVAAFGEAVFDLIEQEPGRLREVTGIGAKRASRIVAGWADQKAIRGQSVGCHADNAKGEQFRNSERLSKELGVLGQLAIARRIQWTV